MEDDLNAHLKDYIDDPHYETLPSKSGGEFSEATKKKILISCMTSLCIANMMLLNVAVFLPTYLDEKNDNSEWDSSDGYTLNSNDVSIIIAVFSIA